MDDPVSEVIDLVWRWWSNARSGIAKEWGYILIERKVGYWTDGTGTPWEIVKLEARGKIELEDMASLWAPHFHGEVQVDFRTQTMTWSLAREVSITDDWRTLKKETHRLEGLSPADVLLLAAKAATDVVAWLLSAVQDAEEGDEEPEDGEGDAEQDQSDAVKGVQ